MANTCYFVLAKGAKPTGKTNFDLGEDIETFEMEPAALKQAFKTGKIKHALTVAALGLFFQEYKV
jgi:hypothetical protein